MKFSDIGRLTRFHKAALTDYNPYLAPSARSLIEQTLKSLDILKLSKDVRWEEEDGESCGSCSNWVQDGVEGRYWCIKELSRSSGIHCWEFTPSK